MDPSARKQHRRSPDFCGGLAQALLACALAAPGLAAQEPEAAAEPAVEEPAAGQEPAIGRPSAADLAKQARLAEIAEQSAASRHPLLGRGLEVELAERLPAAPGAPAEPAQVEAAFGLEWSYAMALMRSGELDGAIAHHERALALIDAHPESFPESVLAESLYALSLTYFRLAERRNCIAHHSTESCIFPLRGGGVHIDPEGAHSAQALLERLLALPEGRRLPEARWLYNIAHMALETWPAGVPAEHRLPPERFASEGACARFSDVAKERGLLRFTRAGSAVLDDFDGDGRIDVLSSSFDPGTPLALFQNTGALRFEEVTAERGLAGQLGGLNLVQGDVNGDGRLDVLVLRGGHLGEQGEMPCSLLVQDSAGFFHDLAGAAGIELAAPTQSAAFLDFDGDGALDLFVGYEALAGGARAEARYPSKLWRNRGDGSFEDATAAARIANPHQCLGVAVGDVEGDGDPDLYLSNHEAPNKLYVNTGGGRFEECAAERGVEQPIDSYGAFFFDYDNDGDQDLFASFYQFYLGERRVSAWYWDGSLGEGDTCRLFENDGSGRFADVSEARGLHRVAYPLSASFGDLENDGWPDVYLATGAFEMSALWPNVMLANAGGERFLDVTTAGGFGHLQKGGGSAFADVDGDGDQDVFLQVGGYYPDDGFGDVLFENPGAAGRWLQVDLRGVLSNRFGVGARIRARVVTASGGERDIYGTVGASGSFGSGSLRQELGLGDATAIRELEVRWPRNRAGELAVQRFADVPLDARIQIEEGRADWRLEARPQDSPAEPPASTESLRAE